MKQRFSSLDVKVIAHELSHHLTTLRLSNVYDLSSRIFLLKFAKPDHRQSLVIESGFRCHLTDYTRVTAAAPSAFNARLRKFLRTRRVTSVSQVGTDRIIEFQFSDGQYRLFLEFFAGGNVVLTDNDLTVISLLRVVNEENEQLRVGLKYSLHHRQNYNGVPPLTRERVQEGLERAVAKLNDDAIAPQKGPKKKSGDALRKTLVSFLNELPPLVIDHAFRSTGFDSSTSVQAVLDSPGIMNELLTALEEAQKVVNSVTGSTVCQGFIIAKVDKKFLSTTTEVAENDQEPLREGLIYEDFQPFRPHQYEGKAETTMLSFDGFNKTVDEFFSSIESQKLSSRLTERENNARRKVEKARLDHEKRLGGLQDVQELNVRKAEAIESNLPKVQEAIAAVNGLLAQGMDWMDVARLIEMEQSKGNMVAEMVKLPLKLYENSVTLLLAEATYGEEDDYEGDETDSDISDSSGDEATIKAQQAKSPNINDKRLAVDVDLALSPWSNARLYYEQKKSAAVKEQKTLQSSAKALKSTEKKINADLKKGLKQEKEVMRPQRRAFWFEKFIYFISSEGYLVIGGKDAQQNEILYKKYLKKGDVYIHADLQGAASIVVKNRVGMLDSPIPPSTLSQAGTLAVATSSAWDSKAGMSAWWVDAEQVSKTDSTAEYLTTGVFTIRGQKNFLPPAHLLLGFGLLFKVSEDSKARHLKHRVQDRSSATPDVVARRMIPGQDEKTIEEKEMNKTDQSESDGENLHDHDDLDEDKTSRRDGLETVKNIDEESSSSDVEQEQQVPLQTRQDSHYISQSEQQGEKQNDELRDNEVEASASEELETGPEPSPQNQVRDDGPKTGEVHAANKDPPPTDAVPRDNGVTNGPKGVPEASTSLPSRPAGPSSASGTKAQAAVRGKHGKRNKLKAKYAEQDEEDRALAMQLLGSTIAQDKATEEATAKVSKEQELANQRERRRKQHELAATKGKEMEEIRRLHFEEGIETHDDGEADDLQDLDAFVGAPLPGDDILEILVMAAPWDAIGSRCRWKAKLQPGSTKKGKAVREILGTWGSIITDREKKRRPGSGEGNEDMMREERVRQRESELIRSIREPEVIGIVPVGKVRVMMGPGEASSKGKGAGKGKRGGRGSKK